RTLRILAPLALWMHEVSPGVGLVKREDVHRKLADLFQERGEQEPETAARQFLADVHEHAALLLERGSGQYGFIHLTFEEYLAAMAIAINAQGNAQLVADYLGRVVGEQAWREVSLLTVSYLGIIQQLDTVAGEVVELWVEEQPGEPGEAVVLTGEAVLDACPEGVPPSSQARVIAALVETVQSADVKPELRQRAGRNLGRLGWQPEDLDAFIPIPAGPFLYGEEKRKEIIEHPYEIAKYPVTNLQYGRFIDAKGYKRQEFWSEDGWDWRMGDYNSKAPEEYQNWLKGRPPEKREEPFYWQDGKWSNPLAPVVGVSWFEAEAYCNWLAAELGKPIRLPTEQEWERAARGTDGRAYPWGEEFNRHKLNCAEFWAEGDLSNDDWRNWLISESREKASTTLVSQFTEGQSPDGVIDMSGNVWEWVNTWWTDKQKYRVMRGGSWFLNGRDARCAVRYRNAPVFFGFNMGFRVVSPGS
ncbi:MAG: hypothetical protein DRI56_09740, partial [Chloroflexota bacterium]